MIPTFRPRNNCIAICLFVSARTFRPWTHTSDHSYIYQLSLVVATATVSSCLHPLLVTVMLRTRVLGKHLVSDRSTLSRPGDRWRPEILTDRIFHSWFSVHACSKVYDTYVQPCRSQYYRYIHMQYTEDNRVNDNESTLTRNSNPNQRLGRCVWKYSRSLCGQNMIGARVDPRDHASSRPVLVRIRRYPVEDNQETG